MKLGIMVNPAAGRGKAARVGERVRRILAERDVDVVDVSAPTATGAQVRSHDAAASGIDALIVVGGDGTVNLGANAVAGFSTPLGIVPAGSGNDAARALGIPMATPAAIDRILAAVVSGRLRTVDAATVVHDAHPGPRWFVTAAGCGLDAAVNIRSNGLRHVRGPLAYVAGVALELPGFLPFGYRLTIDGTVVEQAATLVNVANTSTIGGGLIIAPAADPADGLLDVVIADAMRPRQALGLFPKLYKGSHVASSKVHTYRARTIRVEDSGQDVPPPALCADGEVFGPLPATIAIHKGTLTLC